MPYATNGDIRIHYQIVGDGDPLILHHGSFASGSDWQESQYADTLKRDHQLIMIDARGHGASDKPYDPVAYDLPSRVSDVTAVLDALQIERAHFFGYSMGGWIGFGMAKYAPARIHSLILGGAHPFAESLQGFRDSLSSGMENFISILQQAYGSYMTPGVLARHKANDLQALLAMSQDRGDFSDVLPAMTMPVLLFVGEADPRFPQVRRCAETIKAATFFSLPECGHVAALARHDLVLPHVKEFLHNQRRA